MKTFLALTLVAVAQLARAEDELPKPQVFARYEPMMNRSPFAIATAAAPPPQAPNFAKDLYVANAGKDRGEAIVTLASNVDKNLKEYVTTKAPNAHGYLISNIEWSDRVGATKVTITKDGQFATLTFNQALLSQPVANAPPQPQPQPQVVNPVPGAAGGAMPIPTPFNNVPTVGGAAANPINRITPAPIPSVPPASGLPTPPPRVRGVIQRNPNGGATPVADDRAQLNQDQ
ncbi:MAG TPA: hypothetical protein VGC85_11695 [Chthoniobacterales bacterium]|jgi:hypothetical protein